MAACLAGVFTLEEGLKLVAVRGRLMQEAPRGVMISVEMPERGAEELLKAVGGGQGSESVAVVNGPKLSVLSGPEEMVERLEKELRESRGKLSATGDVACVSFGDDGWGGGGVCGRGEEGKVEGADVAVYLECDRDMDHGCGSDRSWILGEAIATSGKVLGRAAGDSQRRGTDITGGGSGADVKQYGQDTIGMGKRGRGDFEPEASRRAARRPGSYWSRWGGCGCVE